MAIRISGNTVIDDSGNWTGGKIPQTSISANVSLTLLANSDFATSNSSMESIASIYLENNKNAITYVDNNTSSVRGFVVTKSGDSISYGNDVVLGALTSSWQSSASLNANQIITFCDASAGGSQRVVVSNVVGTTITVSNTITLSTSSTTTGAYSKIEPLDSANGRILAVHTDDLNYVLRGRILTVSGNSVFASTEDSIETAGIFLPAPEVCVLNSNTAVITYTNSSGNILGRVLSISGTTISTGASLSITGTDGNELGMSLTKLSDNKVYVTYARTGVNTGRLFGKVLNISGTTLTAQTEVTIFDVGNTSTQVWAGKAVLIDSNPYIVFRIGSTLYGKAVYVSGNSTSIDSATTFSTTNVPIGDFWKISRITDSDIIVAGKKVGVAGANAKLLNITYGFVTPSNVQTLTNKRINPRVVASSTTLGNIAPNSDTTDVFNAFGLTGNITMLSPTGVPVDGQRMVIRIKDNAVTRNITWTTTTGGYRAIGVTLPTATTTNKITYVGCVYNSTDGFWDVIGVTTQA